MRTTQSRALTGATRVLVVLIVFVVGVGVGGMVVRRPLDEKADLSLFWNAWSVVDRLFYGEASTEARVDGAIAGMVAGLGDPYTQYLPPEDNERFQEDLTGEFGGIGAELTVKDGLITVVSALRESPAEKAGLKADDIVLKIDDTDATVLSLNQSIERIRGDVGTDVRLTVAREGESGPLVVTITRDTITVDSVEHEQVGSVRFITVNQFGADTVELFEGALKDARTAGDQAVVVDLRNNPGGYLDGAIRMLGMVLPDKASLEGELRDRVAVIERGKKGGDERLIAKGKQIWEGKLIVLVNEGSASASEIFAGAVKDYKRGTVVGATSFGKGSVQQLEPLPNGGSLKITVANWYTPLGSSITETGITPDVVVTLQDGETLGTADTQALKALELAR